GQVDDLQKKGERDLRVLHVPSIPTYVHRFASALGRLNQKPDPASAVFVAFRDRRRRTSTAWSASGGGGERAIAGAASTDPAARGEQGSCRAAPTLPSCESRGASSRRRHRRS